jgi:hypothetical protein
MKIRPEIFVIEKTINRSRKKQNKKVGFTSTMTRRVEVREE